MKIRKATSNLGSVCNRWEIVSREMDEFLNNQILLQVRIVYQQSLFPSSPADFTFIPDGIYQSIAECETQEDSQS